MQWTINQLYDCRWINDPTLAKIHKLLYGKILTADPANRTHYVGLLAMLKKAMNEK